MMTKVCNPHPDAPHGFCRDASHSAGGYICECESWEEPRQILNPLGMSDKELVRNIIKSVEHLDYLDPVITVDCRTCAYMWKNGCSHVAKCVNADMYKSIGMLQLWEKT